MFILACLLHARRVFLDHVTEEKHEEVVVTTDHVVEEPTKETVETVQG